MRLGVIKYTFPLRHGGGGGRIDPSKLANECLKQRYVTCQCHFEILTLIPHCYEVIDNQALDSRLSQQIQQSHVTYT